MCFQKNVLKTLFPETCGFAQIALRKTLNGQFSRDRNTAAQTQPG
jgi:hypothetical protein